MEDIRRYFLDIVCTEKKGSKPSLLHSKSIGRDGIDIVTEERDVEKSLKTLLSITQSPSTLLKFCLCAPELARIVGEIEHMVELSEHKKKQQHHSLNTPALE